MRLYQLIWISLQNGGLTKDEMHEIARRGCQRNSELNITGALSIRKGSFFQVLEGENQIILQMFSRIAEDMRHKGIRLVQFNEIPSRRFTLGMKLHDLNENELLSDLAMSVDSEDFYGSFPVRYDLLNEVIQALPKD